MVTWKQYGARKRVSRYIINQLKGLNKMQSAIKAGYSEQTALTPSLIESRKTYAIVLQEILDTSSLTLQLINNNLFEGIQNGDLEGLDLATKAQILQRLTDSHVKLTPKVTIKQEETGLDGVKRTLWSEKQA